MRPYDTEGPGKDCKWPTYYSPRIVYTLVHAHISFSMLLDKFYDFILQGLVVTVVSYTSVL